MTCRQQPVFFRYRWKQKALHINAQEVENMVYTQGIIMWQRQPQDTVSLNIPKIAFYSMLCILSNFFFLFLLSWLILTSHTSSYKTDTSEN